MEEIKCEDIFFNSEINIKEEPFGLQEEDPFPEEGTAEREVGQRQKHQKLVEINTNCSDERKQHHSSTIKRTKREGNKSTEDVCDYKCTQCDDTFSDAFNLSKHVQSCNESKAFARRNLDRCYSNEISKTAKDNSRTFKCNDCDYSCVWKNSLTGHTRALHLKEKPFKCAECDYSCVRKDSLIKHIRTVHLKEKPFKCTECDYSAIENCILSRHIKTVHKKEKAFQCLECTRAFGHMHSLNYHILSFHRKEKPFKCSVCNYKCVSKSILSAHTKKVHLKETPFKCCECSMVFGSKRGLTDHVLSHLRNNVQELGKPLQCNACSFCCNDKSMLRMHFQFVHARLKPFKCDHCIFSARYKCNLEQHVLTIHKTTKKVSGHFL